MRDCLCVFPTDSEEEMVTLPGPTPDTALRVYLQSGPGGYVRLQQLAHNDSLGWYVQKTMVVERDTLELLLPHLRKGLCLIPKTHPYAETAPLQFPRPATTEEDEPLNRAS